jgi:hypothetical protein
MIPIHGKGASASLGTIGVDWYTSVGNIALPSRSVRVVGFRWLAIYENARASRFEKSTLTPIHEVFPWG